MLALDPIQTLALAGLVLFGGYRLRTLIPPLARFNVPAPVVGGLVVALALWALRATGREAVRFDTAAQPALMIAFFTSIGFGASASLLRAGGPQVALFFLISTGAAILQNVAGVLLALPFGLPKLFGVLAGSVTLTGGPATGLAFAPLFEAAGVPGAATVAVAAAMGGIVAGGLIGGPVATGLAERAWRKGAPGTPAPPGRAEEVVESRLREPERSPPAGEDVEAYALLASLVAMLVAMGAGAWVSRGFDALGVKLPAYIGAMIVAALLRNLADATGWPRLSQKTIDDLGSVSLSLFLALALMTLRLWELAGLALPLLVMLAAQVALVAALSRWAIPALMGRDYDAAVMSAGFAGFMLGTTANAMANMKALVERYGPAPRAFLVVPMVGAFFIDFTNALIITACLNLLR